MKQGLLFSFRLPEGAERYRCSAWLCSQSHFFVGWFHPFRFARQGALALQLRMVLCRAAVCCLLALALCPPVFVGNALAAEKPQSGLSVSHYREIPGITAEEIKGIEKIRAERGTLIYGVNPSAEAFLVVDTNEPGGFCALLAKDLSRIFGINIKIGFYDWGELIEKLNSGEVSFTSELTPTPERLKTYCMSIPVARRTLQMFSYAYSEPIERIKQTRKARYVFLEGSTLYDKVLRAEGDSFIPFFVQTLDEKIQMLKTKAVDAFFEEEPKMALVEKFEDGEVSDYYPLTIEPVSLTTADKELAPLISALSKYIQAGYGTTLLSFYHKGNTDFLRNKVFSMLSDAEKAYIRDHVEKNTPIPVILEGENYPNSFWNDVEHEFQGSAVEILGRISELTGLRFNNVNTKDGLWTDNLVALEKGDVAFVTDLTRTKQREGKFVWTSDPYGTSSYVLASLKDMPDINILQIQSSRIGVQKHSGVADLYNEWFPGSNNVTYYSNNLTAFEALDKGEVDFVMMSRNTLLGMTNYLERSGYRANLIFNYPIYFQFGFNKKETLLASIINKAQSAVPTDRITSRWTSKTFDYAKTRGQYWLYLSGLLSVVFVLLLILFISQRRMNKRLEKAVEIRTHELSVQTTAAEFASRAKRDFLSNMSHEIRTPLNAIIGMTEIALREGSIPAKVKNALKEISSASCHLRDIINDILDFSKIEAGRFELNNESFRLFPLLDEVYSMMQQRCTDAKVNFITEFSEFTGICVEGDRLRIKQVLINLLGNAIKFTPEKGTITFQVESSQKTDEHITLYFAVKDSGIGMTEEQVSRLFTTFEQADKSIATKYGGTGLGLTISQNIIKQMGSKILVESKQGAGSSFTFTLTLTLTEAASSPEIGDIAVPDLGKYTILLAEDIAVNRLVLCELLSGTNVTIEEAVDGQAAVEMFKQSPIGYYALIFMDIQMPRKNGYEATMEIRALERSDARTIPIIAMTANAYRDDVLSALDAGMNAHIAKPIDLNRVLSLLTERLCLPQAKGENVAS